MRSYQTRTRASAFRGIAAAVLLTLGTSSAWATDPLVLFLLRMLRDQIVISAADAATERLNRPAPPQYGYPQPREASVPRQDEPQRLKMVIEESYGYLAPAQRDEIHAALMRILGDPRNAALRPQIVASFVQTARAVQQAQQTLESLSQAQKHALASQARHEYERLGAGERRDLMSILRAGQVPIPADLTEMMVAEFSAAEQPPSD